MKPNGWPQVGHIRGPPHVEVGVQRARILSTPTRAGKEKLP